VTADLGTWTSTAGAGRGRAKRGKEEEGWGGTELVKLVMYDSGRCIVER
jgi:hypothetical protein